jgi:nucleoside-diphosphate-sugar epimerase
MAFFGNGTLVTGSSGFLGSHVCAALEKDSRPEFASVDVRDASALAALAKRWRPEAILHLASRGAVLAPLGVLPDMFDVGVDGLLHLLRIFTPKKILFPSSCAVYGDTRMLAASPSAPLNPISVYGLSKVVGERILIQWAAETRNAAVLLRIGNLVGRGGRGLIAYLTSHALRYPNGNPPAGMRGAGRLVRDYVPVDYAARIFQAAINEEWDPGEAYVFNVGCGKPRTNGQVAAIVQQTLIESGITLNIDFHDQPGAGESPCAILDTQETQKRLGIEPPSESEVTQAIREMVHSSLDRAQWARSITA